jgi:hypothetical protein
MKAGRLIGEQLWTYKTEVLDSQMLILLIVWPYMDNLFCNVCRLVICWFDFGETLAQQRIFAGRQISTYFRGYYGLVPLAIFTHAYMEKVCYSGHRYEIAKILVILTTYISNRYIARNSTRRVFNIILYHRTWEERHISFDELWFFTIPNDS